MEQHIVKPLKILRASAGSGKTFSLTVHFLLLLFSGRNKYRHILAVTFTNKATAEMKGRILSVLRGLAKGEFAQQKNYVTALKETFPELSDADIREKADLIFRQILHDYSRFAISTIDKFVQQVIRSFTFELGIDSGYRVELNLRKVALDLREQLHLALDEKPALLQWIIDYARRRISNNEKWSYQATLLQLAGVIFSEDYQAFDQAIQAEDEDALFKETESDIRKIKSDFERRFRTLYLHAQESFRSSGLHADLLKGKTRNALLRLEDDPDPGIVPKLEKYAGHPEEWENKKSPSPVVAQGYALLNPMLEALLHFYHTAYPGYQLANALEDNIYYLRLMKEMSRLLARYREAHGVLLVSDATRLLSGIVGGTDGNPSFIWEKSGNRFTHFLFDEFQDTSRQQWQNFLPLVQNALGTARGRMTEHLIVGDVKQSIYRWRNGDWRLLLHEAMQDLGHGFVAEDALTSNFRSAENIVRFNNLVFKEGARWVQQQLNRKIEHAEGPDYFDAFWKQHHYDDIIERAYADVCQEVPADSAHAGGTVTWEVFGVDNNLRREAQVQEQVLKYTADTLYRWIVEEKRYRPGQIGILVRTARDAVRLLDYLVRDQKNREVKNAFPVISGGTLQLDGNDAIRLLINTLYLLCTPEKQNGVYKLNCVQLFRQVSARIQEDVAPLTADDWLRISGKPLRQLGPFLPEEICRQATRLMHLPLAELTEQLILYYGLQCSAPDLPYLFAFRDHVAAFCNNGDMGVPAFLEWWAEQDALSLPANEAGDVVQVITIHKAKGLAYDVVMLPFPTWSLDGKPNTIFWPGVEQTPFARLHKVPLPYSSRLSETPLKNAYYEEMLFSHMDALNTLYVALTRARRHLVLCLPGTGKTELKSYMASDIIRCVLGQYELEHGQPYPASGDAAVPEAVNMPPEKEAAAWAFTCYPQGHHLKLQLNREVRSRLPGIAAAENIRFGIILHELLSRVPDPGALSRVLHTLQQEGWFPETEKQKIEAMVKKVLSHAALRQLLELPYEILNEQDILDADGNAHRPDKILCGKEETIILDFKFTGEVLPAHFEQMETYKQLLVRMGYPGVKAYLFYGLLDRLVTA